VGYARRDWADHGEVATRVVDLAVTGDLARKKVMPAIYDLAKVDGEVGGRAKWPRISSRRRVCRSALPRRHRAPLRWAGRR